MSRYQWRSWSFFLLLCFSLVLPHSFVQPALTDSALWIEPEPGQPPPLADMAEPVLALREHVEMEDVPASVAPAVIPPQFAVSVSPEPAPLRFKTGDVMLTPGLDTALSRIAAEMEGESTYVVVQYARDPLPEELATLEGRNYERLDYIPENGFIVRVAADRLATLADQSFVRAVVPLRPAWKVDPQLEAAMDDDPGTIHAVTVEVFEPLTLPAESSLERVGERLRYVGRLTVGEIDRYLRDPHVQWVELQPVITSSTADAVKVAAVDNVWGQSLDGSGVQVGIIDSGIEAAHFHFNDVPHIIYATDHVDGGVPNDELGHGTHVAGIVAGQGAFNSQTFRGIAPAADLIIERVLDGNDNWQAGSDYGAIYDDVADEGADVINNSWGAASNGNYGTLARDADEWARNHPNVALVFANGNGSMDTPAIAKNVIAVGATDDGTPGDYIVNAEYPAAATAANVDLVSNLNDISPPDDGRIKPDINAPGQWVTAPALLSASEAYTTWRGTSMAAPYVAGIIALLQEKYQHDHGVMARTDLVKAALINSAVPLGTKPGQTAWEQGWGRVQAFDFIYRLAGEELDFSLFGTLSDNSTQCSSNFTVPSGAVLIKATMTYLDPPAALNANPALVNNLNMWLSSPSDAFVSMSSRNNVEHVTESNPEAGLWQICVSAPPGGIPSGIQDYAAVVSVIMEETDVVVSVPSSVAVAPGDTFDINVGVTASGWFAYGTYVTVESVNGNVSLASGSRDGWIAGDLIQETWSPSDQPTFRLNTCGNYYDAIKVTVGGTNFGPISRDVDVGCDRYEDDDVAAYASTLVAGSPQSHLIVPADDVDYAKFTLSRESAVVLETDGASGDTRLWLRDSGLQEVDYNDDKTTGDYFSRIARTCEVDPLPTGTYYVVVDEFNNNDEIWGYTLSLDVTPCADSASIYLPLVLDNYDSSLMFFDDFSDPGSGWPEVLDQTDYRLAYLNGEYQVDENVGQLRIPNSPVTCERCGIDVDARFASVEYSAYGIAFAKQGGDFYMFTAWPEYNYCYVHKYDGSWTTLVEDSCTLNMTENHLRVEWDAPAIRTYANSAPVFSLSDGSFSGARMPSVVVWGTGDARFDNFEVRRLP